MYKSNDANQTKPSQIGPELGTAQPQLVFIIFFLAEAEFFETEVEETANQSKHKVLPYGEWSQKASRPEFPDLPILPGV